MTKRKIKVLESDIKEAFKFNMQPEETKDRKTARLALWNKDSDQLKVEYHNNRANHRYHEGAAPFLTIPVREIIQEQGSDWPIRREQERLVKEEYEKFQDMDMDDLWEDEEFNEYVDSWLKEAKEVFWSGTTFKEEVKTSEHPEIDKIEIKVISERQERINELVDETNLSEREAELYVLTEELGYTVQDAADEMGIKYGNASKKRSRIREKIEKAEKTAELSI